MFRSSPPRCGRGGGAGSASVARRRCCIRARCAAHGSPGSLNRSMASILIQGGTIIDPSQKLQRRGDLLIRDGKIASIVPLNASSGSSRADQVIDATNCFVTPGLIDIHVHFREPGDEEEETIASGSA